jgi:hypothetical protein
LFGLLGFFAVQGFQQAGGNGLFSLVNELIHPPVGIFQAFNQGHVRIDGRSVVDGPLLKMPEEKYIFGFQDVPLRNSE